MLTKGLTKKICTCKAETIMLKLVQIQKFKKKH